MGIVSLDFSLYLCTDELILIVLNKNIMVTNNSDFYPQYQDYTRDDRKDNSTNTQLLGGELWYE